MTRPLHILAFAGSARRQSLNKKLSLLAAEIAEATGDIHVTWIDLKDFSIPLYDGDHEEEFGQPDMALKLRALFKAHDALIIASPEYNGFPSPLLKNAIDWVSRPLDGEPRHAAFLGKPVLLLAATRGEGGGQRGLQQLRVLLGHLKASCYERHYLLPRGNEAFDADARLHDRDAAAELDHVVREFVAHVRERKPAGHV